MFEINLVPEIQKQKQVIAKRNSYATIAAVVILGIVILVLVILGSLKVAANVGLKNTKTKIESVREESEQYHELEKAVLSLENGLNGIKETLNGQNNWTLLLPHLEAATPSDVQFTGLSIEGASLKGQLKGQTVNSIARFIESYKNYNVLIVSGTGQPQEEITVTVDGANKMLVAGNSGAWTYATKINPTQNHVVEILQGSGGSKASYNKETEKFTTEQGSISAKISKMFTEIETKQYTKSDNNVTFDVTLNFLTEALW